MHYRSKKFFSGLLDILFIIFSTVLIGFQMKLLFKIADYLDSIYFFYNMPFYLIEPYKDGIFTFLGLLIMVIEFSLLFLLYKKYPNVFKTRP